VIDITVVVPTFRRPRLLRRCLESLAIQEVDQARVEIIVVDDGSGDETAQVLAEARQRTPPLRPFTHSRNLGPAAARNRAVAEARGDVILFLDDDVVATPKLVATHLQIHRSSGDDALGVLGLMRWDPGLRVTPFMRWLDRSGLQFGFDTWIREGAIDPPYAAFYTCNLSMRRRLVADAGGFDERFPYPAYEDMELAWRLAKTGFHLEHRPSALAYHARPIDLGSFAARMTKVGESAVLLKAVQPEIVIDEPDLGPAVRRRERFALRIAAPLARFLGAPRTLERHYRAEIAAAYAAGRERGAERVTALGFAGPRTSP
jgi:GT2 family glycosyltransferase